VTRRPAVHQLIPTFAARDAIGNHAVQLRDLLRNLGFASDIFADEAQSAVRHLSRPVQELPAPTADQRTWLLYQCSTRSRLADLVSARPEPLVLNYHNITPAERFAPWEPVVAAQLVEARRQLAALAPRAELGVAVSAFNAAELDDLGGRRTVVAPIIVDAGTFDGPVDEGLVGELSSGGGTAWLFVGRVAPHKAQHDVVKAFALYRRVFDPGARLWLVGGSSSDAYLRALRGLVGSLGLGSSVRLAGSVSAAELAAYYRAADVFVCASDHEGFCVPVLEAMHHGLPVVAFASSAIPETVGEAGVVLPEKSPGVVAAAVWRVVSDGGLRDRLVAAGRRRVEDFAPERARAAHTAAIERFVELAGSGGRRRAT
jgi:glycosyltransferase involved in cell wall biosynthesis